ncbi:MAG: RNA polymerase sigma factor [Microscillaceae bacterium]|jgi:RNA polymerase sigma-70 factor (ECF subfamily)|nr:RNA polymerase sigma factor [Microscillaceae bacterium]
MDLQTFKLNVLPARNKLHRFATRLLGSAEEAEDTVQDVFLRMWNMREKLDAYHSVEALAMRITKNICLDKQKSRRNQVLSLDNYSHQAVSSVANPERKMEMSNTRSLIEQAISQLPETQKMIIQLRDIEEYEFEEIADIMQADVNYIRVNLSRARKKIREILTNTENYGTGKN